MMVLDTKRTACTMTAEQEQHLTYSGFELVPCFACLLLGLRKKERLGRVR